MALWETGPRMPSEGGRYIPAHIRRLVMERDGYVCQYCNHEAATDCDHVYPWAQGGTHHERNLVAACETCNSIAGSKQFTEFARKQAYILERRIQIAAATRRGRLT